jgi:hypothetical protein
VPDHPSFAQIVEDLNHELENIDPTGNTFSG